MSLVSVPVFEIVFQGSQFNTGDIIDIFWADDLHSV